MHATSVKQSIMGCTSFKKCFYKPQSACSYLKYSMKRVKAQGSLQQAAVASVYEPHIDGSVLAAQAVVLGLSIGVAAYWWYAVVPAARRSLAREKRAGPLKTYLVELQSDPSRKLERWFYTDWLRQLQSRQQLEGQHRSQHAKAVDDNNATEGITQQEDAKQPQFWSLDNPILATAAAIGTVVLVSVVMHGSR